MKTLTTVLWFVGCFFSGAMIAAFPPWWWLWLLVSAFQKDGAGYTVGLTAAAARLAYWCVKGFLTTGFLSFLLMRKLQRRPVIIVGILTGITASLVFFAVDRVAYYQFKATEERIFLQYGERYLETYKMYIAGAITGLLLTVGCGVFYLVKKKTNKTASVVTK